VITGPGAPRPPSASTPKSRKLEFDEARHRLERLGGITAPCAAAGRRAVDLAARWSPRLEQRDLLCSSTRSLFSTLGAGRLDLRRLAFERPSSAPQRTTSWRACFTRGRPSRPCGGHALGGPAEAVQPSASRCGPSRRIPRTPVRANGSEPDGEQQQRARGISMGCEAVAHERAEPPRPRVGQRATREVHWRAHSSWPVPSGETRPRNPEPAPVERFPGCCAPGRSPIRQPELTLGTGRPARRTGRRRGRTASPERAEFGW